MSIEKVSAPPSFRMKKIFILILIIFTAVVYFNSLGNGFVLDDADIIVHNPIIKSWKLLPLSFKTGLYEYSDSGRQEIAYDKMYRPLQVMLYFLNYHLWGSSALGFRITNIFIHIINAFLIYILFSRLCGERLAKITALFFAIHPAQVSSVTYISGSADLLAALFTLLSILLFLKYINKASGAFYAFSLVSAAVALFCRESAVFLFLFILLVLFISKKEKLFFLLSAPFLLVDLFYILLRYFIFGFQGLAMHPAFISLPIRALNFLNISVGYATVLLVPQEMRLIRTTPLINNLREPRIILALIFILLGIYFFRLVSRFDQKALLFGAGWFFAGLAPVFFLLDGYPFFKEAMMAESWLYLSSAGFFLCLVLFIKKFKIIAVPLLAGMIIFYAVTTVVYNSYWKSDTTVYVNTMKYMPERNPLHKNLAMSYLALGRFQEAALEISKFAHYYPESSERYLIEGEYYFAVGDIKKAIESFKSVLVINKHNLRAYDKLSQCYAKLGDSSSIPPNLMTH